jgi:hypothetical protein
MTTRLLCIAFLSLAFATGGWTEQKPVTGFIRVLQDGSCVLNGKPIECDRAGERLRQMHLTPGYAVLVNLDDDSHQNAFHGLLNSLNKNEIERVFILPSIFSNLRGKSADNWIFLEVFGDTNHPLASAIITIGPLKSAELARLPFPPIVLTESEYARVHRLITGRVWQSDCVGDGRFIPNSRTAYPEHRLSLTDHSGGLTTACILPQPKTSCQFLAVIIGIRNVVWGASNLRTIRAVADEIEGCDLGRQNH